MVVSVCSGDEVARVGIDVVSEGNMVDGDEVVNEGDGCEVASGDFRCCDCE